VTSALRRREGLIVITGEIGTGKTMLCRTLLETFREARTFLSVVLDPGLSVSDLLYQVLSDFGLVGATNRRRREPLSDITRHQLVTTLQQFLASLIPLNAHAVIMIDEAQHLSPDVLEEIRLLSNFETDRAKLLQIVLVGQPNLDDVLQQPGMRQLNQRIARRWELQPLSETEVLDYIDRRLFVASRPAAESHEPPVGGAQDPPLVQFNPPAIRALAAISGGIPRIINTVCDRSLELAFERDTHAIDASIVREAARGLKLAVPGNALRPTATRATAMAASIMLVAALGFYWWSKGAASRDAAPAQNDTVTPAPKVDVAPAAPSSLPAVAPGAKVSERPAGTGGASTSPSSPAPAAPAKRTGVFEIAVAAFKTERRAVEIAAALAMRGLPASSRSTAGGTWFQVIVGPFDTDDAANAARLTLVREGFSDARVTATAADERQ
jgi:general secretion pathway protein A